MKALYIVSDTRSGSTLLQHLLALQDGVIALGEVRRLEVLVKNGETCACGRSIDLCPFWMQVASHVGVPIQKMKTIPSRRLLRNRYSQIITWTALRFGMEPLARKLLSREHRAAAHCLAIYHAASKITGNRVVVDASKVPSHLLHLYLEGKQFIHPVYLIRDGRGVVWSKMKRVGINAAQASKGWLNAHRMMVALRKVIPDSTSYSISYEELCTKPIDVLERILNPLNISVRSIDLIGLPIERHDLGGSPRFRGKNLGRIKLDERWRSEMPKNALFTFEKIAGVVNRKLGYR